MPEPTTYTPAQLLMLMMAENERAFRRLNGRSMTPDERDRQFQGVVAMVRDVTSKDRR